MARQNRRPHARGGIHLPQERIGEAHTHPRLAAEGFFAYGDGIFTDRFIRVDEIGMVNLKDHGIFYLPAFSVMYRDNRLKFAFEKSFTYTHRADVSMADYLKLFVEVFGDNGKVAIAFILATLFRDFIFDMFEFFPILNIFGKPQSGKEPVGKAMKGFFTNSYKPINYEGETYPASKQGVGTDGQLPCAFRRIQELYRVAQSGTAQINVGWRRARQDEGRRRGARERQLRRYPLSGQEMSTIDPALFTRILHLTVNKTSYTLEERRRFADLMELNRAASPPHYGGDRTPRPLCSGFPHFCELTRTEVVNCIARSGKTISDRMYMNWVVVLASFWTLERITADAVQL